MLRIEGFSEEAKKTLLSIAGEMPDMASILYHFHFKREVDSMNFVSGSIESVAEKISKEIDERGDNLSTIIKGVGDLWDISLSKFILNMIKMCIRDRSMPAPAIVPSLR